MKRHTNHQIDEAAIRMLHSVLPLNWVINEQTKDYGKDFHVEIGDEDDEMTGIGFFIQLKGHANAHFDNKKKYVKHSLQTKHAKYYLDKIKDLPVFIVVVDVGKQQAWWKFLQPILQSDQSWRRKKSLTIRISLEHSLNDIDAFREAIVEAKKWMNRNNPESIRDAVLHHNNELMARDPRFDVEVSLRNDRTDFTLHAKEEVSLQVHFSGDPATLEKKLHELIERGSEVVFEPGEIRFEGSELFSDLDDTKISVRSSVSLPGTFDYIGLNSERNEIARLPTVQGSFSGGRSELRFSGSLADTLLQCEVGPIAPEKGGSVKFNFDLKCWNGQRISRLSYFDQLSPFFRLFPKIEHATFICQHDGNVVFQVSSALQKDQTFGHIPRLIETIAKARQVSKYFGVDPIWSFESFDEQTQLEFRQLYSVLFGDGWFQSAPNEKIIAHCVRDSFNFDVLPETEIPGVVSLESVHIFTLLGEEFHVGKLVRELSHTIVRVSEEELADDGERRKHSGNDGPVDEDTIRIEMIGSPDTMMAIRQPKQFQEDRSISRQILSEKSNVDPNGWSQ